MTKCRNYGKKLSFEEYGNDYCRACLARIEADEARKRYYEKKMNE